MKKLFPFLAVLVLFGCAEHPTSPYVILKSTKPSGETKLDVQVYGRLTKAQLVAVAAKIKKDSSKYDNLEIDYLLPGNSYKNVGGITVYATATYHDKLKVTAADTVDDLNDNKLSFEFNGFTPDEAKKMLAFAPTESAGKFIVGKFIDDNTQTVTVVFKDNEAASQFYIIELDTTGKIVSATEPMIINQYGMQKLLISQKGDFITVKNGLLTMYSSDDPLRPYRSIKEGM